MSPAEQGCAELAERLMAGTKLQTVRTMRLDGDLERAATILSRLTVEELAGVIRDANVGDGRIIKPLLLPPSQVERLAQALLSALSKDTEASAGEQQ